MKEKKSRRDFLREASAGATAITLLPELAAAQSKAKHVFATGRVLGANDRINVGFVGCGGRMGTHIRYLVNRAK